MNRAVSILASLAAAALLSANAHAALIDRGNGMIYDTALNITWLQDANYMKTLYGGTGDAYYDSALLFAEDLEYGGFDDWRLPSARLIGSEETSNDGSTDVGWNNTRSELGHLYYVDLKNNSIDGFINPGNFIDGLTGGSKSFLNLTDDVYWLAEPGSQNYGMVFDNWDGLQYVVKQGDGRAGVMFVRDGDVAAVPVPATVWLLSSGLLGLAGIGRRANKQRA
jgi:hypothetical protein